MMKSIYMAALVLPMVAGFLLSSCVEDLPKEEPAKPPTNECKVSKVIRVGVVDTGFGWFGMGKGAHLCKYGHKDFTKDQVFTTEYKTVTPVPLDKHGHGTNVIGLIDKYAKGTHVDYCIVVIKYYDPSASWQFGPNTNNVNEMEAIKYATNLHLEILNISAGGGGYVEEEHKLVKEYIDGGGTLIAAAGNEHEDLKEHPYYPAMADDRVVVVGSLNEKGKQSKTSNFGDRVDEWEVGDNQLVYNVRLSGTSQATAVATGKKLANMPNECYKK